MTETQKTQKTSVTKFTTKTGNWWLPAENTVDLVIKAMRNGEYFESDVIEVAKRFITPGSVALDIGSNFGQMAVVFSELVGPEGRVHAFEADAFVFDLLLKNIRENKCENVETHFGAVWCDDGLELHYPEPNEEQLQGLSYGSFGIDLNTDSGRIVKSFTIDSLEIQGPISFIKVDIQGSDLFAMQGAKETIRRDKPAIVFEYEEQFQKDFGTCFEDYLAFVRDIDYVLVGEVGSIEYVRNLIAVPKASNMVGTVSQQLSRLASRLKNKRWPG